MVSEPVHSLDKGSAGRYPPHMWASRNRWVFIIAGALLATTIIGLGRKAVGKWRRYHAYDALVERIAAEYAVDPRLLWLVVARESRFDAMCRGKAGEIGLMQVTPAAAGEWAASEGRPPPAENDLLDPETNARAGAWYLARALRHWQHKPDPLPYALAEYNAGRSNARRWAAGDEGNADRFVTAITYPTTRAYVRNILRRYYAVNGQPRNGATGY